MLNKECGQIGILTILTLIGIGMMITHQDKADMVFTSFSSALLMRMQLKRQDDSDTKTTVTTNPLSITQEKQ